MIPDRIEEFENGDVKFTIHQWDNPLRNLYWIQSGFGSISFTEDQFDQLLELLTAYGEEVMESEEDDTIPWVPILTILAVAVVFTLIGVM